MATTAEKAEAIVRSIQYFKKHPHMLDDERHRDAIETIKCNGNHICTDDAEKIYVAVRSFIRNESG